MSDSNPDHDEPSDRQLVLGYLRARGESEFRALYKRHTPALYRMASRLVPPSNVEDVMQETWCRAAQQMGKFQWRSALLTWLTGILVRCCRESRRASADVLTLPSEKIGDEPELETDAFSALDIERALENLPAGFREILVLHDIEGFTHDEIARALGIVPGTSKSQLSRARRAMRQRLEGPMMPIADGGTAT